MENKRCGIFTFRRVSFENSTLGELVSYSIYLLRFSSSCLFFNLVLSIKRILPYMFVHVNIMVTLTICSCIDVCNSTRSNKKMFGTNYTSADVYSILLQLYFGLYSYKFHPDDFRDRQMNFTLEFKTFPPIYHLCLTMSNTNITGGQSNGCYIQVEIDGLAFKDQVVNDIYIQIILGDTP